MRHAAPTSPSGQLGRATQVALAAVAYTIAGMSACLISLAAVLAIWSLWQWLGVN